MNKINFPLMIFGLIIFSGSMWIGFIYPHSYWVDMLKLLLLILTGFIVVKAYNK